jgi:hypothetical protein
MFVLAIRAWPCLRIYETARGNCIYIMGLACLRKATYIHSCFTSRVACSCPAIKCVFLCVLMNQSNQTQKNTHFRRQGKNTLFFLSWEGWEGGGRVGGWVGGEICMLDTCYDLPW